MYSKRLVVKVAKIFDRPTIPSSNSDGSDAVESIDEDDIPTIKINDFFNSISE